MAGLDAGINNQGFSILEVIIASAIGVVLTLGIVSMATLSSKVNRGTEMSAEQLELNAIVRRVLSSPASCTANLAGEHLDLAGLTASTIVPSFAHVNPGNSSNFIKGMPIVQNKKFGKIAVDDFKLIPLTALDPSTWLVRVKISTHKTGDFMGAADGVSEVSVKVKIDTANSKVLNCIDSDQSDFLSVAENNALSERVCELSSGGTLVYDPATAACVPNLNCFPGTADAAACPSGSRISGCDATNVVDLSGIPPQSRPLRNGGGVLTGGAPLYECESLINRATNTVACIYVQNVDTTNAKCRACCLSITSAGI